MSILNKFVREDGSVIDSTSIISCSFTEQCNSEVNLSVGDVTASTVELCFRVPERPIVAGEKLLYYQIEDGEQRKIGLFYAEAPQKATSATCNLTAYDGVAKLETDFSEWLNSNQASFPLSLRQIANQACSVAGLELSEDTFQGEEILIPAFYAQGVTARQIVSWVAQIAGRFVQCDEHGKVEFAWYRDTNITISAFPGNDLQYYQSKLTLSDYQTDRINRVQFKQDSNDIGVIYPTDADGNVFSVSQNGLAALLDKDVLLGIARRLYEQLKDVSYTPLSVSFKRTSLVRAGDIVSVTDSSENTVTAYAMKVLLDSSGTTIECTGNQNYSDKAAVSSEKYSNIPGRILSLQKDIDGLFVENKDTEGKVASLELTVNSLKTQIKNNDSAVSEIAQTAEEISITIQNVIENGVSKVSTEFGLTVDGSCVDIHRSGEEMHNILDETGMYVKRNDEIILQANNAGVIATDVTVRNYLIVGANCRFEDYSDGTGKQRTACFWIG